MDKQAIGDKIVEELKKSGFFQLNCSDVGALPPRGDYNPKCFVSKLKREEAVEAIDKIAQTYGKDAIWAEDYGQYHADYKLKEDSGYIFGFGITRVKFREGQYKDKNIEKEYETDIIYSPPHQKSS